MAARAPAPAPHRTRSLGPSDLPWWVSPAYFGIVLGLFALYSFWTVVLGGAPDRFGPYLSPFYSPPILEGRVPFSPAMLVAIPPLLFRATCYYYRKVYYRAYFWDPPACTVAEPRHGPYRGETRFPLILNNLHRFAFYAAALYIVILAYDAINAFSYQGRWGIGLGTVIMLVNIVLLAAYTFSCHSCRHLVGGRLDCYSCSGVAKVRYALSERLRRMNELHGGFAFASLYSVWLTDVYIRLLQHGILTDPHIGF